MSFGTKDAKAIGVEYSISSAFFLKFSKKEF